MPNSNGIAEQCTSRWKSTLEDSRINNLLEKLLTRIQIQDCFSLGFSQKYYSQHDIADKVLYVEEGWRCNFLFRVKATQRGLQHEWISVESRFCPPPPLSAIRQRHLALIFQATSPQAALRMSRLLYTPRHRGVLAGVIGLLFFCTNGYY